MGKRKKIYIIGGIILLLVGSFGTFLGWYSQNILLQEQYALVEQLTSELEETNLTLEEEITNSAAIIDDLNATIEEMAEVNYSDLSIEEMFRIAASQYGIDFKLIYAIAIHETGDFSSGLFLNSNNPGGLKGSGGWMSYPSRFEGILAMARTIYNGYWSQGMTTPEAMQPKYCPNSDTWAPAVRSLMERIH